MDKEVQKVCHDLIKYSKTPGYVLVTIHDNLELISGTDIWN